MQKTLDGLYIMMAEDKEGAPEGPAGGDASLINKVFGALGQLRRNGIGIVI